MMTLQDLRERIQESAANLNGARLLQDLRALWEASATPATASFILSYRAHLRSQALLSSCRVAVSRSFTVDPAVALLRAAALLKGIDLEIRVGGFNAYAQEIRFFRVFRG